MALLDIEVGKRRGTDLNGLLGGGVDDVDGVFHVERGPLFFRILAAFRNNSFG